MQIDEYKKLINKLIELSSGGDICALQDCFKLLLACEAENAVTVYAKKKSEVDCTVHDKAFFDLAHNEVKKLRSVSAQLVKNGKGGEKALEVYKDTLLFDAPYFFDEAMRYAEFDRPHDKKFYEPRRKQLLPIVQAMQELDERKIKMLLVMLPPGAGKTTLALMFLAWTGGKHPELGNLIGSHSALILQGMYGELQRMLDKKSEYLWHEIFPHSPLVGTDAKNMQMDLKNKKRFSTYQFASVGAGNAGRVRAQNLLYLDDLVPDLESSMNHERMEKLWKQYNTDYLQRMIGDCAQLVIQTPWSLHDPIDRLAEIHENDKKTKIIRLPALDENDESNFDYPYGVGFTTKMYHEIRETMDDISWQSLYMLEPAERGNILYEGDELRKYFELPDREPDAVVSVVDIADGGGDYWVMPVAYQYGSDYYIEDFLCDSGKPEVVAERLVEKLIAHKVKISQFESNRGGGVVATNVQKKIKERDGITKITTKWNQTDKLTRIIVNSPWVKEHCLFKDDSKQDKEYKLAMRELNSFNMSGKNKHDDVPDAMSSLAEFSQNFFFQNATVIKRSF